MVGLVDIAPLAQGVPVRGQVIEVSGISAEGVANLLSRFPELGELFNGRSPTINFVAIQSLVPRAIKVIIAAGCGTPGDEQAEVAAGRLTIDEQADLLNAIVMLTLPHGLGPFVQKLAALGSALGVDQVGERARDRASRSPKQLKS